MEIIIIREKLVNPRKIRPSKITVDLLKIRTHAVLLYNYVYTIYGPQARSVSIDLSL